MTAAASDTPTGLSTFDTELRIEQSVHLVGQIPILVIGNCLGTLTAFLLSFEHVPTWLAAAWVCIPMLCIPMVLNWRKLRRAPRPGAVSARRIRVAGYHSLALGLSWAAMAGAVLPLLPPLNRDSIIFGLIILSTGAVASVSELPRAAVAYFVPIMTVALGMSLFESHLPYNPLGVLSGMMFVALVGFLRQNWKTFVRNVRTSVELTASLDKLRRAQDRLIQTEKLASLGQLTAGIAHEIKNPLNFVSNFSSVSKELVEELTVALVGTKLDHTTRREVDDLTGTLKANLDKVVQHGKRADAIVKNMLLHSREGMGERRMVDLNATAEESLNLAYHGARAEKPDFNVTLKTDLDPTVGLIEIYPQEFVRVLLNLISNGFYAAQQRKREDGSPPFEPALTLATKGFADRVEIRVRDNGKGIPDDIRAKMFHPFFTTKPAGQGTGLGLSLSHDIVVKQHGGTLDVDTTVGEFTEFVITLPRG
jgi:signal transduction histidine kinase